jgi:flavin-dependent dehydrogenase
MPTAAIIGAGPAGSTAATLLGRAGWDVTLVEQHRFPRDKVCGECLSALGVDVLSRHGLNAPLRLLRPVKLRRSSMIAPDGSEATLELPAAMWGLSRVRMDEALLDLARAAGARILQPARAEHVATGSVSVRDLLSNEQVILRTDQILVADGKAALGAPKRPPTGDLGVKAHFVGVAAARDTIELFGVAGHYVGLAPIEDRRWNVAMSVPAARVSAFGGDFDALFARMREENIGLARRFAIASRLGGWIACPLPRFAVARDWPQGIIPLGNAAAALEPIGGEGMGLALRSAELAAEALIRGGDVVELRRAYERLWRTRRTACRAAAMVISSPRVADLAVQCAAGVGDSLARIGLKLIGK